MKLDQYEKKLSANLEIIIKEKARIKITDNRSDLLNELDALEKEKSKLESELKKYKDSNPVEYERTKKNIEVNKTQKFFPIHFIFITY